MGWEGREMTHGDYPHKVADPVEILEHSLDMVWHDLCCTYDASGHLPSVTTLFEHADLAKPYQAARTLLANMLMEIMENIGRYSPWYRRPARAFGLTSIRDPLTGASQWMLAPEAAQKYQTTLDQLSTAIEKNYSVIHAMILMEGWMDKPPAQVDWVVAHCECDPPRTIQVTRDVLRQAEIRCDACLRPFS
jgi:hypothetical protein